MFKLIKLLCFIVPLVLNDDLFMLELVYSLTVHQVEDGVKIFTHICISGLEGLDAVFIHSAFIFNHACWQVKAFRLKCKAELLKVSFESFLLVRHLAIS